MEDEVKEDPAKPKEVKFKGKAGWLKKSSGKFLSSYKDRYIQLDKTEIVVYESEDLKNCVERLDLENFDKCHELRSPFKKKNRLILMRSPKSGSKVCDVKLQAQNQEEKDAWIKALSDGINRAKNKIFDEVKVDESSSLEHVTRSRPKGNRGRRPPTRIHMKETANVSSDGILRLDLDVADDTPNGMHFASPEESEGREFMKPLITPSKSLDDIPDEAAGEELAPVKKVLKPPMPPSKENKPSECQESEALQKKVLMPPMPPSKEKKPTENIGTEDMEPSEMQEKKVLKPPMPPSKEKKPSVSVEEDATQESSSDSGVETGEAAIPSKLSSTPEEAANTEPSESSPPKNLTCPPTPPSKDMKPSMALTSDDKEGVAEESEDVDDKNEEDSKDEKDDIDKDKDVKDDSAQSTETTKKDEDMVKIEDTTSTLSNNVSSLQEVMLDSPSTALDEGPVQEDANKSACLDTAQSVAKTVPLEEAKPECEIKISPHSTLETVKKVPPAPPKKKPVKLPIKMEVSGLQSGPTVSTSSSLSVTVTSSVEKASETEEVPLNDTKPDTLETKDDRKVFILSLNNPGTTEEPEDIAGAEVEEKSIDSGQLSAEDSETGDQVTSSTDKLQGSLQGFDGETSEEDLESSDSKVPSVDESSPSVLTVENAVVNTPAASLNSKLKSASTGDLLEFEVMPQGSNIKDLQSKVSTQLEETGKLLSEIEPGSEGESKPEILLTTAMEKLKKAEEFLKEARSFKELENKSNRTSW